MVHHKLNVHSYTRRSFLKVVGIGAVGFVSSSCLQGRSEAKPVNRKPNVVLVIADDMAWHHCGPYGDKEVKTPNMDRLASQGMTFDMAFTATAMCAPTRQQLYTGLFPVRNGAYPNHSRVKAGTRSIVHHLKALGYRVGLKGKTHFKPPESFPFAKGSEEFVTADKDQPFCLIVASHNPHGPWTNGPKYDPDKLTVPPYLVDNPETRKALAAYCGEITAFDEEVGHWMEVIDDNGLAENAIFIVTTEQGSSFPGGKWTCYDLGLHVGFIVRWPAKVKAGVRTEAMIQYVDVVPTLIEAAGAEPAKIDTNCPDVKGNKGFDGRSFLDVLLGKTKKHNDYVFGVHTTNGIIAGNLYPVRSVRDKRYRYIANLMSENKFQNVVTDEDRSGFWQSWVRDAAAGERAARLVKRYRQRPVEELYDLRQDPWEMNNLAAEAQYRGIKTTLLKKLDAWMAQQGDKGIETEKLAKTRQGRSSKQRNAGRRRNRRNATDG